MGWVQPPHATPEALRAAIPFLALCGVFTAYDVWRATKRDGSTWSELTRVFFNTETPEGEALFRAAVEMAAAVYVRHILK